MVALAGNVKTHVMYIKAAGDNDIIKLKPSEILEHSIHYSGGTGGGADDRDK